MTYGIGIIGCGLIGRKRAENLPENCRIASLYDINFSRAEELSHIAESPTVQRSAQELLVNSEVDVVVIATSHADLAEIGLAATSHGKHVFLEKPGGRNVDELREIQASAEINDSIVGVGYNHRFHPSFLKAREIIRSQEYGKLLWVRGRYGHGGRVGYDKEWRANREISGGGELLDQGSHLIDLTHFLFGESKLIHSHLTTAFWDMDVEDNAFIQLEVATGGVAWLHASWTEWKNTFSFEIALERAKLEISGLGGSYGEETITLYEMQPEMGPPPTTSWTFGKIDSSWTLELQDFLGRIESKAYQGADLVDAIRVLSIIKKAYEK